MKNGKRFKGAARETYLGALEVTVNGDRKDAAIYWGSDKKFGTLSLAEAQELIEVLQAIIADYPKEPTNEEILNELPVGSVVQAYSNVNFMKAGIGWYNPMGYLYSSKRLAQEDFTVKLRGPEDGGDE